MCICEEPPRRLSRTAALTGLTRPSERMRTAGRVVAVVIACLLLVTKAAWCQTAYTDPEAFVAALAGLAGEERVGFDQQGDGTGAGDYGALAVSGQGLDSDGKTTLSLPMIATAAYESVSPPNSLGAGFEDTSLLAGNSDRVVLSFRTPVNAVGVYLIGNPSPTGEPAIPFWRMRLDIGDGYEAYSDTQPLSTLSSGDDVYFLGVVSPVTAFSAVGIFSDNDPSAVFSFTVDDVIYSSAPRLVSLPEAKSLESEAVMISNVVVTRKHADRFNVQMPYPPVGIAVLGTGADRGDCVTFTGVTACTGDGERVIDLGQIVSRTSGACPAPLIMRTRAVGGSPGVGLQPGTSGAAGPNNIGLDATILGRITAIAADCSWMVVDDGCGRGSGVWQADGTQVPGVKVVGAIGSPLLGVGVLVSVSGSVSLYSGAAGHFALLRVADPQDIIMPLGG